MFRPSLPARILALLLLMGLSSPAAAQVNRCTTAEGHSLYTDKPCETLGARNRLPRDNQSIANAAPLRRSCNRELQDLIFELTAAIDNRDVNRLSSLYHWPGASTRGGYVVMQRLDAIAQRPLVGITEIFPEPPQLPPMTSTASAQASEMQTLTPTPARTATPPQPTGLRIEQTLANQATPSQAVFGLRRHLGCWWITL